MKYVLAILVLLLAAVWALADAPDAVVLIGSHGGSGTVIATGPGWTLILSAAHMFRGADAVKKIRVDAPAPTGGQPPQAVGISLLGVDTAADLALIRLGTGPLPFVAPVAPVGYRPCGLCLSVGYDNMKKPSTQKPATIVLSRGAVTFTAEKPWHGRSGGALLNGGYLVGVVSGYTPTEGFYASHQAVVSFIGRLTGGAPLQTPPPISAPIVQGGYADPYRVANPFALPCPGGNCLPGNPGRN